MIDDNDKERCERKTQAPKPRGVKMADGSIVYGSQMQDWGQPPSNEERAAMGRAMVNMDNKMRVQEAEKRSKLIILMVIFVTVVSMALTFWIFDMTYVRRSEIRQIIVEIEKAER